MIKKRSVGTPPPGGNIAAAPGSKNPSAMLRPPLPAIAITTPKTPPTPVASVLAASPSASQTHVSKDTTTRNLEWFVLLWLDESINKTQHSSETLQELRGIINHIQTFDNTEACEAYIRQAKDEKVVLIVSDNLGQKIIPTVRELPQLSSFYVYCQNKTKNEEWANQFTKLRGVFVNRDALVQKLASDQKARNKSDDSIPISVITHNTITNSLESRNALFLWFQLFIDVLLRMHHKLSDRNELIELCKSNYAGNETELKILEEFEQQYKPEKAVWWYTREWCLYRILNKALRVQDLDAIYALRFFLSDLAKLLKKENEHFDRTSTKLEPILKVYRGQLIGLDELELMKSNSGQYVSMNCFLSTSTKRSMAVSFAHEQILTEGLGKILFEIDINTRISSKPFADISNLSYFPKEEEILLMFGAMLRIESVKYEENEKLWIAQLTLASDDDFELKNLYSHLKKKIGEEITNLDSLGKILIEMGEYKKAITFYQKYRRESDMAKADSLYGEGTAAWRNDDYKPALQCLEEAVKIRKTLLDSEDDADIALYYNRIGSIYNGLKDYDSALDYLKKALDIQDKILSTDHIDFANTYNNIAIAHHYKEEFQLALEYYEKTVNNHKFNLPSNHYDIGRIYGNMGSTNTAMGNYKKAKEYYEKALEIYHKTLPSTHEFIRGTEVNIRILPYGLF
ncbi:unnamed protein product [Adineta steineri]|uniref:ADP ribosyltransferase domain-containing protein n=1 Tax=Adineta steineri TaxID=433720 RepID=A0A815KFE8_9BILA|nr:unnamed protein product [Adineta steineri]CAF3818523.1 unnamed protein product [Adineta steineri]